MPLESVVCGRPTTERPHPVATRGRNPLAPSASASTVDPCSRALTSGNAIGGRLPFRSVTSAYVSDLCVPEKVVSKADTGASTRCAKFITHFRSGGPAVSSLVGQVATITATNKA